jgi:DNA-binding CsgD family transcriptional regulator
MSGEGEVLEGPPDLLRDAGTVAWIDLRAGTDPPTGIGAGQEALAVAFALIQVGRAVRADDRVCPISTTSIVVQFGSVASVVPLHVLGDRLARAIGPCLPFDQVDVGLTVAVGMAAPGAGDSARQVASRARSASGTSIRALGRGMHTGHEVTTAVTVDQPVAGDRRGGAAHSAFQGIHRRDVHRYGAGRVDGVTVLLPTDGDHSPVREAAAHHAGNLCVLTVDPMATGSGALGFPSLTAVSVAERLGCRTANAVVSPDGPLVTSVEGVDIDLVVLVLDGAWVGRSPNWASGAWGLPARLTHAYVDKGIPVLVVSAGAGAGAMAACVAQGALALFNLDRLADALRSLDGFSVEETRQVSELGFPDRFRSLLGLTAGERRVLFYLTEGWAAQDVADELVVSLTTVRSHIRSVLRKLGVRSQLAAVAIANSRDLEHHKVTANS